MSETAQQYTQRILEDIRPAELSLKLADDE
jgi:hypothetical protein